MRATAERTLETEQLKQLISFTIGTEEHGLDLLRVKEVIRVRQKIGEKLIILIDVDAVFGVDDTNQISNSLEKLEN
jgi:hypothetical protein